MVENCLSFATYRRLTNVSNNNEKIWECDKCGYVVERDGKPVQYNPEPNIIEIIHVNCGGKFVGKDIKDVCIRN